VPIRIYALAKKLNLDSKVLADICTKAGITGKGSALASLSDEEVAKIKAYLEKSKSRDAAGKGAEAPARGSAPAISRAFRRRSPC